MHHGDVFVTDVLGGVGGHGAVLEDHELGDTEGKGFHDTGVADVVLDAPPKAMMSIQKPFGEQLLNFDAGSFDHDGCDLSCVLEALMSQMFPPPDDETSFRETLG